MTVALPLGVEGLALDEYDPSAPDLGDPGHPGYGAEDTVLEEGARHLTSLTTPPRAPNPAKLPCPFVRVVTKGSHGLDVIAIKRALAQAGYRPPALANTLTFGATLEVEVKAWQHAHGIKATGKYGRPTHDSLVPHFDSYGRHLLALEVASQMPDPRVAIQHAIVACALFTLANPYAIGYSQGSRRMEGVTRRLHPPQLPGTADCSGLDTWDYYVAGAPDPSGPTFNYNGQGFTGSHAAFCVDVPFPGPPGSIYLYGTRPTFEHEAIGLGDGSVVSHGTAVTKHLDGHYRPDLGRVVMPAALVA